MRNFALAVRFLIEIAALCALGYWGFTTGGWTVKGFCLGLGTPLLAAVAWGAFVAPRAPVKLPAAVAFLIECVVFVAAAFALYGCQKTILAIALLGVWAFDKVLLLRKPV